MRQRKPKDLEKRLEKYSEQMITAPAPESVQEYFHAGRPLMLEIGCGKGQFIRKKALDNPDKDYIAIEGQDTVILRALEKVAEGQTRQAASYVQGSSDGLLPCTEAGRIHRDKDRQ